MRPARPRRALLPRPRPPLRRGQPPPTGAGARPLRLRRAGPRETIRVGPQPALALMFFVTRIDPRHFLAPSELRPSCRRKRELARRLERELGRHFAVVLAGELERADLK